MVSKKKKGYTDEKYVIGKVAERMVIEDEVAPIDDDHVSVEISGGGVEALKALQHRLHHDLTKFEVTAEFAHKTIDLQPTTELIPASQGEPPRLRVSIPFMDSEESGHKSIDYLQDRARSTLTGTVERIIQHEQQKWEDHQHGRE